jgi:hypothetical protein
MDMLLDALLAWIGEHSAYDVSGIAPPDVVQMSPAALTAEYYTGVAHLIPDGGVDVRLNALYAANDGAGGTIYILRATEIAGADRFDDPTANPLWREILLHELVHHVQWRTGEAASWACPAMGEKAAYHLGGVYLRQTRTTDPLPNRTFWGHIYSRC